MSKDNVVKFNGVTCLDMPADMILREAIDAGLEGVVVLGYTKDGGKEYFASSIASGSTVSWLMDRCKHMLLSGMDGE